MDTVSLQKHDRARKNTKSPGVCCDVTNKRIRKLSISSETFTKNSGSSNRDSQINLRAEASTSAEKKDEFHKIQMAMFAIQAELKIKEISTFRRLVKNSEEKKIHTVDWSTTPWTNCKIHILESSSQNSAYEVIEDERE